MLLFATMKPGTTASKHLVALFVAAEIPHAHTKVGDATLLHVATGRAWDARLLLLCSREFSERKNLEIVTHPIPRRPSSSAEPAPTYVCIASHSEEALGEFPLSTPANVRRAHAEIGDVLWGTLDVLGIQAFGVGGRALSLSVPSDQATQGREVSQFLADIVEARREKSSRTVTGWLRVIKAEDLESESAPSTLPRVCVALIGCTHPTVRASAMTALRAARCEAKGRLVPGASLTFMVSLHVPLRHAVRARAVLRALPNARAFASDSVIDSNAATVLAEGSRWSSGVDLEPVAEVAENDQVGRALLFAGLRGAATKWVAASSAWGVVVWASSAEAERLRAALRAHPGHQRRAAPAPAPADGNDASGDYRVSERPE